MDSTAMRGRRLIVILLALAVLGAACLYWFDAPSIAPVTAQQDAALSQVLNTCEGITEKAALALPPVVVEFQRLEHAGRKAHVFQLCMRDHGYQENPLWTNYAQPRAQQLAGQQQVSVDAATETLRRADMVRARPVAGAPAYWSTTR